MATNSFSKESHLFIKYFSIYFQMSYQIIGIMILMAIQSLISQLVTGEKTSLDLVRDSLKRHNQNLDKNALAVISPLAIDQANFCDRQRQKGLNRGPLHGIPIVIKDNILYADGTPTTANSYAFKDFVPQTNAFLVNALIDAGAIILAKANLSEFAYFMGDDKTPSGYGSMYGQVKHPVDPVLDPYGSSTGSAVAVALNIVPAAIGTETNGSLMAPAHQCQIVSFKPTPGMISRAGIIPISPTQDTAGPMAQTVYDCALLMEVMAKLDLEDPLTKSVVRPSSFIESLDRDLPPRKIGLLVFPKQEYHPSDLSQIQRVKESLTRLGHVVVDVPLELPELNNYPTLMREFKIAMNEFLNKYGQPNIPHSLAEIITFNEQHAERCLRYGQETLIQSQAMPDVYDDTYHQLRTTLVEEAKSLEAKMVALEIDFVFAPTWLGFAPIYGQPSLCLPTGYVNGKPTAMTFVAKKGYDLELLHFGYHFYDRYFLKLESKR
jgi:amidase